MKKIKQEEKRKHKECSLCNPIKDRHLNMQGEPILGECRFNDKAFLLSDFTTCKEFKR